MRRDSASTWRLVVVAVLLTLAAAIAYREFEHLPVGPTGGGDFGYTPNPTGTKQFLRELDRPLFADAGAEVIREAKGRDTFLYRSAQRAHMARYGKEWVVGRQSIGDCVAWGWSCGCWTALCVDWELGKIAEPPLMVATESVYGGSRVESRGRPEGGGGWGDGSYGGAAAKWVRDWGVIFRQQYGELDGGHNLLEYSGSRAKNWGNWGNGGQGDGGKFDAVAKRHPCKHVALVKNFKEAAAAIEAGYPVPVCSGQGFSSRRTEGGWAEPSGRWSHCMCFTACRYGDRPGLLCQNSWGAFNSGPVWPDDQPVGSFWVDAKVCDSMLAGEDSFAVGMVDGFRWRDLHHGNWLDEGPK